MIVTPYKRTPEPPTVALLHPEGVAVDEHGTLLDFDAWPAGTRCFASYDTARSLVNAGIGEAVCWNAEEIHWRHKRLDEDGWVNRSSDVHVLKLPFDDDRHDLTVAALRRWRDWLASFGAAPTGTTGSAAWSLLRATLEGELRTSEPFACCPPLWQTLGGRQEVGPHGQGSYRGRLEQIDLPAAYASSLGSLPYGGRWFMSSALLPKGVSRDLDWWAAGGRPLFVKADVKVASDIDYGPLPRRPRGRRDPLLALGLGCEYPVGARMTGVWTWQELQAAELAGTRVLRVHECWGHFAGERRPFEPWWAAVQKGREMPGLAGLLAKMTGNALWGRFCSDSRTGKRTIRGKAGRRMVQRALVFRGGQPPAHDLAETISGRCRASLYGAMVAAGPDLISAHTDGLWVDDGLELDGWRSKQHASRLDLLTPQVLRFWPVPVRPSAPWTVFAGVPAGEADRSFAEAWGRAGFDSIDERRVA